MKTELFKPIKPMNKAGNTPEDYANLYVAIMMNEMKPRAIITKIKKAYIAGFKAGQSKIACDSNQN